MNPTQNRKNPERDPAGSSKRVKVKQEVAPRTHLLTAVPSNSPNSLCWLGLVSAGLSWLGWITEGSDWDSGLAPAGSASARWFRSSVRRQVLVSLAGMGVSGVFSCSWRCSCSRTGRTSAAPVLARRSSAGGRGGTVASLLWNDGLREYSGIGPAHPGGERKRGRKSERKREARMWGWGRRRRKHVRRCRDAGSKSRSGSDSDAGLTRPLRVALVTQRMRHPTRKQRTLTAASIT